MLLESHAIQRPHKVMPVIHKLFRRRTSGLCRAIQISLEIDALLIQPQACLILKSIGGVGEAQLPGGLSEQIQSFLRCSSFHEDVASQPLEKSRHSRPSQ